MLLRARFSKEIRRLLDELAPYWASRLGKNMLTAQQVSKRGGDVLCEVLGNRVVLYGSAVTFMVAEIYIGD